MQVLAPTTAPTTPSRVAPAPGPHHPRFPNPDLPGGAWTLDRPGGAGAPAAANVVGQVVIEFPMNFRAKVAQDLRLGRVLETHASIDDARHGARVLAVGRTSLGVVRQPDGAFGVAELLLFDNDQMGLDEFQYRDMNLIMGPDPARTRVVASVHQLREPGNRPVLEGLWTRGGNTYWSFDATGDGHVSFNHV